MKSGDTIEKEILRVALGEVQTAEARGGSMTDEATLAILRRLVKSNEETLALTTDSAQKGTIEREISVLQSLMPETLGVDEIIEALAAHREAIRAAANDGQAIGVAMKALKADGASVSGREVSEAVKQIRS